VNHNRIVTANRIVVVIVIVEPLSRLEPIGAFISPLQEGFTVVSTCRAISLAPPISHTGRAAAILVDVADLCFLGADDPGANDSLRVLGVVPRAMEWVAVLDSIVLLDIARGREAETYKISTDLMVPTFCHCK
jgi:hypothetical protein